MDYSVSTDNQLVKLASGGDFSAFDELTTRHERRLYSLVMSMTGNKEDAEDVVQTAFISALQNLDGFREEASFGTWVSRIAVNAALKLIKKRDRRKNVSLDFEIESEDGYIKHPEFISDWGDNPELKMERIELSRTLRDAIEELPEKHRVVFVCRDIQSMSIAETSEVLNLSPANVKVRLLRARLALREKLSRAFGDESRRVYPDPDHEHDHDPQGVPAEEVLNRYKALLGED